MLDIVLEGRPVPHPRMTQNQVRALRIPEGRRTVKIPKQITDYLSWKEAMGWLIKQDVGQPLLDGKLGLKIEVYGRGQFKGDASNYLKAVEDAANGILWHDDRQLKQVSIELHEDRDTDYTLVQVWQLDDPFTMVPSLRNGALHGET